MNKRDDIVRLLTEGKSVSQIVSILKCSKGTVSYYRKILNLSYDDNKRKPLLSYDWELIQNYYDEGNTIQKCCEKFKISRTNIKEAREKGFLEIRNPTLSDEKVFVEKGCLPRQCIKKRILEKQLLKYECECCGIGDEWNGETLVLQLDHINGVNNDDRLENLRFLCPNCHSQQHTYAGKNKTNTSRVPKKYV